MQTRLSSYVGYAIKSRNVVFGVENIICNKKINVILTDISLSENSYDKISVFAKKNNIKNFKTKIEELYKGKNCKAMGITDINLSKAIIKEMEENGENGR